MTSEHSSSKWQDVIESGDENEFRALVEPFTQALVHAAHRRLDYHTAQGDLRKGDYTPEEVVGETLIHAWQHRSRRPPKMKLRSWLLGLQHRVLSRMVEDQRKYRYDKVVSLDDTPDNPANDAVNEQFWEWHQPDEVTHWEDVIPSQVPVDYEPSLRREKGVTALPSDQYHVLMMHDEFEMSLPDVAATMNRAVDEIGTLLQIARGSLQEYVTTTSDPEEVDPKATDVP